MVKVGDIVNYVLDDQANQPGEIRPAIVVRVWDEELVNLQVFIDGENDYPAYFHSGGQQLNAHWKTSILYDADYRHGTWHRRGD